MYSLWRMVFLSVCVDLFVYSSGRCYSFASCFFAFILILYIVYLAMVSYYVPNYIRINKYKFMYAPDSTIHTHVGCEIYMFFIALLLFLLFVKYTKFPAEMFCVTITFGYFFILFLQKRTFFNFRAFNVYEFFF